MGKGFWRFFLCLVVCLAFVCGVHTGLWFTIGFAGKQAFILIGGLIEGLKPEPLLTVTEWAVKHRRLNSKGSSEAGPYKVSRTPYLRKIMDALSARSKMQKVIFMKASQVGASEAGFNIVAYYIDMVPCSMMYVMPTVDNMERRVKQTIDPMIEDCARLLAKIGRKRSRDGGNTLSQKDYPGGTLFLGGANSASSLASVPCQVVIPDEVDRYPDDVDNEGSVISLLERRQLTYGDKKKMFMPSTPTIEGSSKIESEFLMTDQEYYHVPCPHCKQLQSLEFEQLKWEKGKYKAEEVYYECVACRKPIYNRHKTWMLVEDRSEYEHGAPDEGRARWVASHPELASETLMGVHLNGLYSPDGWMSWSNVVEEYDKCENDEPRMKAFVNTILGKTYKVKGDAPPWLQLYERAQHQGLERNKVWEDVAFITAGVDVQADRLEVSIHGWMFGRISQQIDYRVIDGPTDKEDVWADLGKLLEETWTTESGRELQILKMAVDTGWNTSKAYDFCKLHGIKRVIPVKGGNDSVRMPYNAPKVVGKTALGKNTGKVKVFTIGVGYLKEQLYGWLRLQIPVEGDHAGVVPSGYCHLLPQETHYFRGLTAEELVPVRNSKTNAIRHEWVKRYARNEPLDTFIYAMAAAYVAGFDRWPERKWRSMVPVAKSGVKGAVSAVVVSEAAVVADVVPAAEGKKKARKSRGGFWKN